MNIDKFTITSYDQITGFDRANGSLEMILDELSDFTLLFRMNCIMSASPRMTIQKL